MTFPRLSVFQFVWLAVLAVGGDPAAFAARELPDPENWAEVAQGLPADTSVEGVAALPNESWKPYRRAERLGPSNQPPVWLRLRLPIAAPRAQSAVLTIGQGFEERIELFQRDPAGGWSCALAGEAVPPAQRAWRGLRNAFPVLLPAEGDATTLYVRITERIDPAWGLQLHPDAAAYAAREARRIALLYAYFGALGAIFAYNLFLYVRLRYRDLLYYLGYLGTFGAMLALETFSNALFFAWGDPWRVTGLLALGNLSTAALLLFAREFHELPTRAPRLGRILVWLAGAFAAASSAWWLDLAEGWGQLLFFLNSLAIAATFLGIAVVAGYAWKRGASQARLFLLAFGCLLGGFGFVVAATTVAPLWLSLDAQDSIVLVSSALEFVLLSFAIGDRFRRLQREKADWQLRYTTQLEHDVAARTAELARLNLEKDELLGIVAHDLRAPLAALRGTAQLVQQSPTLRAPEDREAVAEIRLAADRMLHLAGQLVAEHASTRGQVTIRAVAADLRGALEAAARRFRDLAAEKNQTLAVDLPEVPALATHDPALLAQILDNLLSNAVKFSPAGANVRLALHTPHAGVWRIAVHDAGPGFTEADRAKLFQPFATRSAQPTARETSFGLGLAAAQKLARALGTEIRADNQPAGGAVFQLDFPAA